MNGAYTAMNEQLRYKYGIKRKYFQHSAREVADGAISDALLAALSAYNTFFVYYSFGSEADTHALISRLLSAGKRVFLPVVCGSDMHAVEYFGDEASLVPGPFGILQPQGEPYEGEIEVCIAPLLAVNPRGYRLGYGGGYYDRYFASHQKMLKAGMGYFLQYTEEFEEQPHDKRLDIFVSERGIISFGK